MFGSAVCSVWGVCGMGGGYVSIYVLPSIMDIWRELQAYRAAAGVFVWYSAKME